MAQEPLLVETRLPSREPQSRVDILSIPSAKIKAAQARLALAPVGLDAFLAASKKLPFRAQTELARLVGSPEDMEAVRRAVAGNLLANDRRVKEQYADLISALKSNPEVARNLYKYAADNGHDWNGFESENPHVLKQSDRSPNELTELDVNGQALEKNVGARNQRIETVQLRTGKDGQLASTEASRSSDFGKNGLSPEQVANQAALDHDNIVVLAEKEHVKDGRSKENTPPKVLVRPDNQQKAPLRAEPLSRTPSVTAMLSQAGKNIGALRNAGVSRGAIASAMKPVSKVPKIPPPSLGR